MDINLAPALHIAVMGGVGYACGKYMRINPKRMAQVFMISASAGQIFSEMSEHFAWNIWWGQSSIFVFTLWGCIKQNKLAVHLARFILGGVYER